MTRTKNDLRVVKETLFADLDYQPHEGQRLIHRSRAPRRVVACGARWGKTTCAAMEAIAAMLTPAERSVGWIVGPTYDLCDRVYREVQLVAYRHLQHRIVQCRESDRRLVLRNLGGGLSEVRGKSADNPVSLLGEGLDWLVVDEASRLKPQIWQSHLSQRLVDKRGWAMLISTPRGKNYFYDLHRRGQADDVAYESWNFPTWTNPLLDRALIEEERERLPQAVFDQEFAAQFMEGAGQVFRNVRDCATGELQKPKSGEVYFGGLDLAKVEDFTVFVILNSNAEVVYVDRFNRVDWGIQVRRIQGAATRYGRIRILCDSTGAGEPIYESLRAAGCPVAPYPFTQRSKNDLINYLALVLEQRRLVLPRPELWPEGIEELEAFEYSVTETGNVRTGAPHGIHDDCVVALALAAWAWNRRPRLRFRTIRTKRLGRGLGF